jgi:hypothetical protein
MEMTTCSLNCVVLNVCSFNALLISLVNGIFNFGRQLSFYSVEHLEGYSVEHLEG